MTIALASDHAGYEQLKQLQTYLESLGHSCHNFGPTSLVPDDDYPDYIFPAAKAVASRVVDARGRTSHDPYEIIKLSRAHNDSNMLSLAANFVSSEDIKSVVKLWLETPFSGEERHERRNKKLDEV